MTCDLVNVWPITRTDLFLLRSSSRCPRIQRAPRMRAPPFKCIVVCLSKPWLTHHSLAGFNSSASLTLACRAWVPSPHIITQSRHSCLVLLGCSSGQLITGITTNVSVVVLGAPNSPRAWINYIMMTEKDSKSRTNTANI